MIYPVDSAIQRLNNRGLKNKKLFSVYDDNIFPFIREFNVFSREELQDYLKFWTVTKNVRTTKHVSKAEVDPVDRVTLPVN